MNHKGRSAARNLKKILTLLRMNVSALQEVESEKLVRAKGPSVDNIEGSVAALSITRSYLRSAETMLEILCGDDPV